MRPLTLAIAVPLAVALLPTLARLGRRWLDDPAAEHGPVVMAIGAWLAWQASREGPTADRPRVMAGSLALVAALWVLLAARLDAFLPIEVLAGLGAIAATVVALAGASSLRAVAFPLAFCAFALPPPGPLAGDLPLRLKLLAASIACGTLDALGVPVVQAGSTLHLPAGALVIDESCSGLRALTAIVAFAALVAYTGGDRRRGAVALALAVPVALAANALRIVVLCGLTSAGVESAAREGALHSITGLAVYVVSLAVLHGACRLVPVSAPPEPTPVAPPPAERTPPGHVALAAPVTIAVAGALASTALALLTAEPRRATAQLPAAVGAWSGTPLEVAPSARAILGELVAARRYVDARGDVVEAFVVHGGADPWRAHHPPDECFLGEGFTTVVADVRRLAGRPAHRRLYRRGREEILIYFWYRVDGEDVASHLAFRTATFARRLRGSTSDATLVRLSAPVTAAVEAAEQRVARFALEALEPLEAAIDTAR